MDGAHHDTIQSEIGCGGGSTQAYNFDDRARQIPANFSPGIELRSPLVGSLDNRARQIELTVSPGVGLWEGSLQAYRVDDRDCHIPSTFSPATGVSQGSDNHSSRRFVSGSRQFSSVTPSAPILLLVNTAYQGDRMSVIKCLKELL